MKIMKAIKNKAETMSAELMAAYTTDRKGRKAAFSVGMVLGSIMNAGVIAHAASITEFGQEVVSVGAEIYNATFAAVTVIAAIFFDFCVYHAHDAESTALRSSDAMDYSYRYMLRWHQCYWIDS